MAATYGFKGTSQADVLAVTNVLSQADQVKSVDFSTLAQYQVKDVELKPASLSFGLPRQWMVTLNTELLGFNQENGQAVYFNADNSPVGDGYLTFELDVKAVTKMLQGGLYVDPETYLARLKQALVDQEFYRKTRVNLLRARVLDANLAIQVGNHHERIVTGHDYLIGKDLQAYDTFTREQVAEKHSNLDKILNSQLSKLAQQPIVKKSDKMGLHKDNADKKSVAVTPLSAVHINSEVSLALSSQSDIAQSQVAPETVAKPATSDVMNSDLPPVVDVKSEVTFADADNSDSFDPASLLTALANKKLSQTSMARRAYVDDFGTARQASDAQQQKRVVKQQTVRSQQDDSADLDR